MSGPRREKVSDLVRDEVARLIHSELHDVRIGFVTVTGVSMSNDLKHARVFVSMLQEGPAREQALEALGAARGFIRRRVGQTLRLRYTPEISFRIDPSIEYGAKIEELIEQTRATSPQESPAEGEEKEQ